jgi:hydrogenase expression/formation protein HypC
MCLAIPGKVEEILTEGDLLIGRLNFGGVVKRVCLDYVPDLKVGDYALVHVGFALSKIDEESARQTLDDFRAMGVLDAELEDEEAAFARAAAAPQSACPDGNCPVFFQVANAKSGEPKPGAPKSGDSGTNGSALGQ